MGKGGGKVGRKEDRVAVVGVGGEETFASRCLGEGNTRSFSRSPDETWLCDCCWLYRRIVKPPNPDPNISLPSLPLFLPSPSLYLSPSVVGESSSLGHDLGALWPSLWAKFGGGVGDDEEGERRSCEQ